MTGITINGKKIQAEDGVTILRAAKAAGIKIPNLCFDKRLRPYGGCRLCVVEVEGQPRLFAACSTPIQAGMSVLTDTPKLRKARQTVLELLLVHHPLDCPVCDKAGECDLQVEAVRTGSAASAMATVVIAIASPTARLTAVPPRACSTCRAPPRTGAACGSAVTCSAAASRLRDRPVSAGTSGGW